MMQLAAFLCVICAICGRIHARVLKQSAQKKPQCLPQISLIYADKTQNNKTALTSPNCLSLRYNAATLHSSARSALSAREYSHKSTQSIYTEETHVSPADLADLRRRTTKQQNHNNQTNGIPLRHLRENKRDIRTALHPRPQTEAPVLSGLHLSSCHNHTAMACR